MTLGSTGIYIFNNGGFVAQFRVKADGKQTDLSGKTPLSGGTQWTYDELISAGFKDGDNCWVSVDIEAGETNHESGGNFLLQATAPRMSYYLSGGAVTPSWDGPVEPAAVIIYNSGGFIGRMRVKKSGLDSSQSGLVNSGKLCSWTFTELNSQGFKRGDNCWVSVDIVAGETNHQSGDNFTLVPGGGASYSLSGGVWNPSFHLD